MRRFLKKIIYFLCLLALAYWILSAISPSCKQWITTRKIASKQSENNTTITLAYSISKDRWTVFPIRKGARFLKVIANPEFFLGTDKNIDWLLDYEILDSDGTILESREYNETSKINLYRERYTKRILSNPFLVEKNRYLGTGYEIIIPLAEYKNGRKIRFKWRTDSPEMTGLSLRVARLRKNPFPKNEIRWYRLSTSKKEELSNGNIYPQFDLTQEEKLNLLKTKWQFITPEEADISSYEAVRVGTISKNKLRKINKDFAKPELIDTGKKYSDLFNLYLNSGKDGIFKAPSKEESEKAYNLFCTLFKNQTLSEEMKHDWDKLGMTAIEISCGNRKFIVVYEKEDRKEGRGFFMFCQNQHSKKMAIEAPHRFFDRKTGRIAYLLMLTGYYSAGAWNTVHRYQTPNNVEKSSDMAHNPDTFFNSFARAFLNTMPPDSAMIQLHGFYDKKHSYKNSYPSLVLSEGRSKPSQNFMMYANAIKKVLHTNVFIYPDDDLETLSAKGNISAETFEKQAIGQIFIHFEMNNDIRKLLLKTGKIRYELSKELSLVIHSKER